MKTDRVIRRIACSDQLVATAIDAKGLLEATKALKPYSSSSLTYLGECLMAGAMIASSFKDPTNKMSLELQGDGPLKKVIVAANGKGEVKGYAANPEAEGSIGRGYLTLVEDIGLKTPYQTTIALQGESVAENLAYYFAQSEQTATSIALGVLLSEEGEVIDAAGYMVQLLPFATNETVLKMERNLSAMPKVESFLKEGKGADEILDALLLGMDQQKTFERKVEFRCGCSKEYGRELLASIGPKELDGILSEGKPIDITCGFCGSVYHYEIPEIAQIRSRFDAILKDLKK